MSQSDGGSGRFPSRRTVLLALLAIGLLAGPLWVEALHLDDRVYRYERAEVTVQDGTIDYVAEDPGVTISDRVLCTESIDSRVCYLEQALIGNGTVPTSRYTSGNASGPDSSYRYVAGPEGVYEVDVGLNTSQGYVVENGSLRPVEDGSVPENRVLYRVYLSLEAVDAQRVLERVSTDVDRVEPPVREAARTGSVRTYRPVDMPESLVTLENGSTYRVYLAAHHGPPERARTAVLLLRYLAPIAGLLLGYSLLAGRRR